MHQRRLLSNETRRVDGYSHFHDQREDTLIPITRITSSIGPDSYAVIYMTGGNKLSEKVIEYLKQNGFSKAKVMFKSSTHDKYKLRVYENFEKNEGFEVSDFNVMMLSIGLFLVFTGILMYFALKSKDL